MSEQPAPTLKSSVLDAPVSEVDPEVDAAMKQELHRQQSTLEMIASENFTPVAVMQAQGSVLTNKYAEGYPGKRYYGGCEYVDVIESLAIERVCALFGGVVRQRPAALRARRPTPRCTSRCCSRATRSSGSTWPTAGT